MTTPATNTETTPTPPNPHLETLLKTGILHLPAFLPPSTLSPLLTAARNLTTLARAALWPHVRTVGKQFPPWPLSAPGVPPEEGIWGVQHLLHPDLPLTEEERGVIAGVYFGGEMRGVVAELVGGGGEGLVMELFNMLVRPGREDGGGGFELGWHRDDVPASVGAEEEGKRLGVGEDGRWEREERGYVHTQWNLALVEEESLVVVPGSHRRVRTEVERKVGPYEELPGQVVVRMKPGDVVFYDNNILHRGVYDGSKERFTLHGSVGRVGGSKERARNVLQHGVGEWVDRCDFSVLGDGREREAAEGMRERLVEMGRENQGREVGYSLEG
ncbi:hypothetical protein C8A05DRAFT_15287 [Staphylotrichum tortipilum]|uniref:Phytanoyl-CoA dioxygenase family protein n=1 Tax=Staphylotrichum tortipilum TaxID=2831512 RepID=A0AAN6RU74_9PEZI|nr:hypothetical protein C8A05DRAFT_15287 [Staphylotrichum longicolle]